MIGWSRTRTHTHIRSGIQEAPIRDFDLVSHFRLMLTLQTHRFVQSHLFYALFRTTKKDEIIYWGRDIRSPQRWRGHKLSHTHTHTAHTLRWQMGNGDNDDGCQKSKTEAASVWHGCGSGAFCNLMEWCDRDVMRWHFIRIPRNLNYVFTAIKMKYYKFNNRVSSSIWSFSLYFQHVLLFVVVVVAVSRSLCVADSSCRNRHEVSKSHRTLTP